MMLSMDDINDTGLIPACVPERDEAAKLPPSDQPELLIISGMSGAGRTRAADTLEDLDWYVVDNLPPRLLRALTGMMTPDGGVRRLAVVVDVRSREFFAEFSSILAGLKESGFNYRLLFLDCSDDELVKRYDSVRRPHPLQGDGRVLDGIAAERALLDDMRKQANIIIDTSGYSVHDLARKIRGLVADEAQSDVRVTVMSFGFKYGLPVDADIVFDVRFLPNPYWVPELRPKTGLSPDVASYVLSQDAAQEFQGCMLGVIEVAAPGYLTEGKRQVTVAIGCTGGKHRSTSMTEELAIRLRGRGYGVSVLHRDLGKE